MNIPLITLQEVRTYRHISNQFDSDDFLSRVISVQNSNLFELLGNSLYTDLFKNLTSQIYIDLINGKEYVNDSGETVTFFGLKPFLSWHFLAGLMVDGSMKLSDIGNINATGNNFDLASGENEKISRGVYLQNAQKYYNEIVVFLDANYSDYPLWDVKNKEDITSFDISFI